MSRFKSQILKIVSSIPHGHVASYGQVALMAGMPRGARQVGWILNQLPTETDVPWWRVINNTGRITIKGSWADSELQKSLLESEGIEVENLGEIEIEKYRWRPDVDTLQKLELDPEYVEKIVGKYGV